MANGMDRLERLFFRKKHAASRPSTGTDRSNRTAPVLVTPAAAAPPARTESRFPQPSFLRPKASRMLPRDDSGPNSRPSTACRGQVRPDTALAAVGSNQNGPFNPYGRFPSVDSAFAPAASSTTIAVSSDGSVCTTSSCPPTPQRSSSLRERRKASISTLRGIQPTLSRVPTATTTSSGEISPTTTFQSVSSASSEAQPPPQLKLRLDELQLQPLCFQSPIDTPPPSDRDENVYMDGPKRDVSQSTITYHPPASPSSVCALTPEASPKMTAASISRRDCEEFMERPLLQRDSVISVVLAQDFVKHVDTDSADAVKPSPPATRRKTRMAHRPGSLRINRQLPVERAPLSADSVLKEPNLGDFLSMSDEDIAETEPAAQTAAAAAGGTEADKERGESGDKRDGNGIRATSMKSRHRTVDSAMAAARPRTPPPVSPAPILRSRKFFREAPSKPPTCLAPPVPLPLPVPTMFLGDRAVTPRSPGRPQTPARQLRMAAAFEIARIASHYKFDLAYIATIWPKNMAIQQTAGTAAGDPAKRIARSDSQASRLSSYSACSSVRTTSSNDTVRSTATASLGSQGSPVPMGPHSGLEAQFLAAYGLASVKAPYSLSGPTHARMLNTERWLRFNEPNARVSEFSMGYGCAFYRGQVPVVASSKQRHERKGTFYRRPSAEDCDADTEQDDGEDGEDRDDSDDSGRATPRPTRRISTGRSSRSSGSSISSSNNSSNSSSSSRSSSRMPNNRGIVFVAYRRKGAGEQTRAAGSGSSSGDGDNLDALYRDVEKLVGWILDFHMMQQRQGQLEMLRTVPSLADDLLAAAASGMEPWGVKVAG